jgi:ATP-dependent RNA helicase RhlE
MSFSSLGLADTLVHAVNQCGYTEPTPIQRQAIPAVLAGGDLLAGAQTGTGKTAAFTLPILQRLSQNPTADGKPRLRALVLTPTRELAAQVEQSVCDYGAGLKLRSLAMFGGVGINPQIDQLKRGIDILVATPGRLLDHVQQKTINLDSIEILVLDEADRMLDMGFIHDIKRILKLLPAKRQNLLFSATFSDEIKALAEGLLDRPALIEVARRNATADTIAQRVFLVDRERKRELLTKLIQDNNWYQVLVFTRTKHGANRLAEHLEKAGISAMAIHGNKSQGARTKALSEFKAGQLQVLVATDIAARGIDISELPHVINFELPNVPEDYVHRIGRTGRAGSEGEALSLVCIDEHKLLANIEKVIKRPLVREVLAGFEPDPTIAAEPIPNGRQRQPRGEQQPRRESQPRREAQPRGEAQGQRQQQKPRQQQPQQGKPRQPGQPGQQQERGNRQSQPQQAPKPRFNGDEQQPLTNENRNPFEGMKPAKHWRSGQRPAGQGQRPAGQGQRAGGQGQGRSGGGSSGGSNSSRPTPRTHLNPSGDPRMHHRGNRPGGPRGDVNGNR